MERWPAAERLSTFHARHCSQQSRLHLNQTSFNRRRNNIFKRAKMKSLYCIYFLASRNESYFITWIVNDRRISVIIVSAFVICWAPYYFMMITFIFLNPNDKVYLNTLLSLYGLFTDIISLSFLYIISLAKIYNRPSSSSAWATRWWIPSSTALSTCGDQPVTGIANSQDPFH